MNANGMTSARAACILEPGVVAQIARAVAAPRAHRATHGAVDVAGAAREMVGMLRETDGPAPRVPTSGLDALDGLIDAVRDASLTVHIDQVRADGPLPATVDVPAYRIL
jgi:hypothetical protein